MTKFTKELINLDGLNLSKPCEGELPEFAIYSKSGAHGESTKEEIALNNALMDDEFGHIEFVGTSETLVRIAKIGPAPAILVMRGDKMATFNVEPLELLMGLRGSVDRACAHFNTACDKDKLIALLREIGTESALAEIAELEEKLAGFKWIGREDEHDEQIWKIWAEAEVVNFAVTLFNPKAVMARHATPAEGVH